MEVDEQNIQILILKELEKIGCQKDVLNQILNGNEIYGDNGLLDSFTLVQLIAGLSELVEVYTNGTIDLFSFMNEQFVNYFRDIVSLSNYLIGIIRNASV